VLGPTGNRTQVTESGPATTGRVVGYGYDLLYRLTSETIDEPGAADDAVITYVYDAVGNRLSRTETDSGGPETTTYVYDLGDRLVSETTGIVSSTFAYDPNGNLLSRTTAGQATTYSWDAENRMIGVDLGGGATIDLTYDADGLRSSRTVGAVTTFYLVDRHLGVGEVLAETTGADTAVYTIGLQRIARTDAGTGARFYSYDGQQSTRQLTDSSGVVTDTYTYDAFGVDLGHAGSTPNEFRYTGEQLDPNVGFYYLRARYYAPAQGRFVSTDPEAGKPYDPPSLHRYLYAHANPVTNADPTGREGIVAVLANLSIRTQLLIAGGFGLFAVAYSWVLSGDIGFAFQNGFDVFWKIEGALFFLVLAAEAAVVTGVEAVISGAAAKKLAEEASLKLQYTVLREVRKQSTLKASAGLHTAYELTFQAEKNIARYLKQLLEDTGAAKKILCPLLLNVAVRGLVGAGLVREFDPQHFPAANRIMRTTINDFCG
jgi:RHS repeat-associated protein